MKPPGLITEEQKQFRAAADIRAAMLVVVVAALVPTTPASARPEQAKYEALQAKYEALLLEHKTLTAGHADGAAAPGRALSPSLFERLKRAHGWCGPNRHFPLDPTKIPQPLLAMLANDVVQPNGCNACPNEGEHAVWGSPGDLCDLQNAGMIKNHGSLGHCAVGSKYRDDFDPTHHVMVCLPEVDLDFLWSTDPPHCIDDGKPIVAKEGLLFCKSGSGGCIEGGMPPSPSPPQPHPQEMCGRFCQKDEDCSDDCPYCLLRLYPTTSVFTCSSVSTAVPS